MATSSSNGKTAQYRTVKVLNEENKRKKEKNLVIIGEIEAMIGQIQTLISSLESCEGFIGTLSEQLNTAVKSEVIDFSGVSDYTSEISGEIGGLNQVIDEALKYKKKLIDENKWLDANMYRWETEVYYV